MNNFTSLTLIITTLHHNALECQASGAITNEVISLVYIIYISVFVCSATLFYIVKGKEKANIGIRLKRRIITALLVGMEAHLGDDTMMRNGCLTLCQFKIPTDVVSTMLCAT